MALKAGSEAGRADRFPEAWPMPIPPGGADWQPRRAFTFTPNALWRNGGRCWIGGTAHLRGEPTRD